MGSMPVLQSIVRKITSDRVFNRLKARQLEFKLPEIKQLARRGAPGGPPVLYIIGGRGGLPLLAQYLWHKGLIKTVGFEPAEREARRLEKQGVFDIVVPYALGKTAGVKALHMTQNPGCASLLLPHTENIERFSETPEWFTVESIQQVEVKPLDTIAVGYPQPDLLQIDTQGYEYEILQGAPTTLSKVACVEVEVVMYPLYHGQPTFAVVHEYMTDHGFVLFNILPNGMFGGDYVEADAYYYNAILLKQKPQKVRFLIEYSRMKAHRRLRGPGSFKVREG